MAAPVSSVPGEEDFPGFAERVVDQDVSDRRVGPSPAQSGVEDQAEQDGHGEQPVDQGDAGFGA